jgi:uncharacterized RDD family membrane protein YckC
VGAYLLDAIPLLIISLAITVPLMFAAINAVATLPIPPSNGYLQPSDYDAYERVLTQQMTSAMAPLYPLIGLAQLFSIAYYVGFWAWRGQTPGMMLLHLRVARESDLRLPGLGRSILRYVGYWISGAMLFIGFIWVIFDRKKQGWHDKIAGTVVLRDRDRDAR